MVKLNKQQLSDSFMLEEQKPTMAQLVKQTVLRSFDQLETNIANESACKYKPEGCVILDIDISGEIITHFTAYRGPHIDSYDCPGNLYCNCSHAEIRVIMYYLKQLRVNKSRGKTILVIANKFWPCSSCIGIILDSKVIDLIACKTAYIAPYILHLYKQQIENDINNDLIRNWLKE